MMGSLRPESLQEQRRPARSKPLALELSGLCASSNLLSNFFRSGSAFEHKHFCTARLYRVRLTLCAARRICATERKKMPLFVIPYPMISPILVEIGPSRCAGTRSLTWPGSSRAGGSPSASSATTGSGALVPIRRLPISTISSSMRRSASCSADASAMCFSTISTVYLAHPVEIFAVWQGGMSFHGGVHRRMLGDGAFARSRDFRVLGFFDTVARGRADRPFPGAAREFRQWRALGPADAMCPGRWSFRMAGR